MDCPLTQLDDGQWWCKLCDCSRLRLLPVNARRNCRAYAAAAVLTKQLRDDGLEGVTIEPDDPVIYMMPEMRQQNRRVPCGKRKRKSTSK